MNAQNPSQIIPEKMKPDVDLSHQFNYVGGAFAYKNSRKKREIIDPRNRKASVLITGYGRARPVDVAVVADDPRAGIFPDHNTPEDFKESMEVIPAKSLVSYQDLGTEESLQKKGFKLASVSLTKERITNVSKQFSHLSVYAFNQMMCINSPDKRDFEVWYKELKKSRQIIIAYPHTKTKLTQFVQVLQFNKEKNITGIKHCSFDRGKPVIVNETALDKHGNTRQLAHIGAKGGSSAQNAVERFDDGTVTWTITKDGVSGTAALKLDGEISIINDDLNESNMLAARNLGAEGLNDDGSWSSSFDLAACLVNTQQAQKDYKDSARNQIGKIVDGAALPGLEPIFFISK